MCRFFDPGVPKQCREDDAEEVLDKEKVNFCEWFAPSPDAFDPVRARKAAKAQSDLAALFSGDTTEQTDGDPLLRDAEDLFK